MSPAPAVSFVIPVYEEGENITRVIEGLCGSVDLSAHEILVVYDRETDGTLPVIARVAHDYPTLRTVRNAFGGGARRALLTGFAEAKGEGACVVMADGSDDLALLPRMIALLGEGWDVICPSRYMPGGRQIGGPWLKGAMSRLAGLTLHRLAGLPTRDPTNNFKLYRASMLRALDLEREGGFEIALEITVKAWQAGCRVTEIPATWRDRTAGHSRFRLWGWLPRYLRWYARAFLPSRRGRA